MVCFETLHGGLNVSVLIRLHSAVTGDQDYQEEAEQPVHRFQQEPE